MKSTFVAGLLLSVFMVSGCSQESKVDANIPTIHVQGTGSVETVPDEAVARFGVATEEKSLEKAYQSNTKSVNAVIAAVKKMGVKEKDIRTSSYSVSPVYPKDERGRQLPGKPVGFSVRQQLTVVIRDISEAGNIIDKVIASGTNTFSSIQFNSSKQEELEKQAKQIAAMDAKENAKLLAQSLGVKVGRLLKVSDSSVVPYAGQPRMMLAAASHMAAPEIQAGSMEISANCSAVYAIVQ